MQGKQMSYEELMYLSYMGKAPDRIPHYEAWSCPDAETYITGIDYYENPKLCRKMFNEIYYPIFQLPEPRINEPKPRPVLGTKNGCSSNPERHTVRWGDGESGTWQHGEAYFKSVDEVFAFSPLKKADFRDWKHVVNNWDFSSEEAIYRRFRKNFPEEWGDKAPGGSIASVGIYNTMFMWPLLTFGWELFLEACLDERFENVMEEFAELNRRAFRAFARLPVNFVICHDDIVITRGPVCSPQWMYKYIFPRYEEFWSIVKNAGKEVIFMSDGNLDVYVDDVITCGARGIITEPYTNFKRIVKKHKDVFVAGEGDNRIISTNDYNAIKNMVLNMVETAKETGGYAMSIGNHIPWNVPPEAVKLYLNLSVEYGWRR
jgi:DNA-binding NarL/FixJ family response regulator